MRSPLRRALLVFLSAILATACAQRTSAPVLLPTRAVPAGTPMLETPLEATQAPLSAAPVATLPARAALGPTSTPHPRTAASITASSLPGLKPTAALNYAIPQHVISVGPDRVLVLAPRAFTVLALSDFSITSRTAFTVPADADVYWYAGSSDTRRAAVLLPDGALTVFDTDTTRVITTLRVTAPISVARSDIALSPDGREVLYVNGDLQRIDVATGRVTPLGTSVPADSVSMHLAEDASRLAVLTASGQVVVLSGTAGRPTLTLAPGFVVDPASLRMALNGAWLSLSGSDDRVIWKLEPAAVGASQTVTGAAQSDAEFDAQGAFATLTDAQGLALYDLKSREVVDLFTFDTGASPRSAHFTPDGRQVVVSSASGIARFDLAGSKQLAQADFPATTSISLSPDGKLAATFSQLVPYLGLDVHDVMSGRRIRRLTPTAPPLQATFSPGGTYLAAVLSGGTIQVWRTADWSLAQQIEPSPSRLNSPLCFTRDEREILHLSGDTVNARELEGSARRSFRLPYQPLLVGGCSETGGILVSDGKGILLLNTRGDTLASIPLDSVLTTPTARLILSPDGRFAALASRTELQIFGFEKQTRLARSPLTAQPSTIGFGPESRRLAALFPSPGGSRLDVIDPLSGAVQSIDLRAGYAVYAFFLPDPDLVAAVTLSPRPKVVNPRSIFDYRATEIGFFRIDTGKPVHALAFDAAVIGVDLSASGTVLGTGGVDGSLAFWVVAK